MYGNDTYTNTSGRGSEFMVGILCGVAVGAALGLLLAPKTGAELRGQLANSADRLRRRAGEAYDQASGAVEGFVDTGRKTYEKASKVAGDFIERGKTAAERGREKFEEVRSTVADAGTPTSGY